MTHHDIHGQQLFVTDQGSGPTLLFLHGFLMDGRMFDELIEALTPRYRCITIDTRAFGRTHWDGEPFTLYDVVDDALALLDKFDIDSAVFCGMSQGGYASLRAAIQHPERVDALALLSTSGTLDNPETREQYSGTAALWKQGPPEPLIEGLANALLGPHEHMQQYWETWLPRWRQMSPEAIEAGLNALLGRDDIADRLDTITLPTFIAHGTHDVGMPIDHAEHLHEILPDSRTLLRLEGGAHAAAMTHAQELHAALEPFLQQLELG